MITMLLNIAMFGEAEKGVLATPIKISNLAELADFMGNPPEESRGIPMAIQALLYERNLFFVRVQEEGFSAEDYLKGIQKLGKSKEPIHAICLPGVGDATIIEATNKLVEKNHSLIITQEQDLYDYLTTSI